MNLVLRFLLILLSLAISYSVRAQNEEKIQLSGIVLRLDSLKPVPYTSIYLKNTKQGVISDQMGLFSIQVSKNDTVVFSSVGSKRTYFIVPDTLTKSSYSIIQKMPYDTITLKQIEINSWPSIEQFNNAFTQEKGFDPGYKVANSNSETIMPIDFSKEIDVRNYMEMNAGNYTYIYENAHIPVMEVLNPKKWNRLVKDWKSGKHR